MFLIVKRYTHYINHLLNHICHIAVRYGEVRINPNSRNYFCYRKKLYGLFITLITMIIHLYFSTAQKYLNFMIYRVVTYKTMIILYKANNHSLNGRVQAFFKPTEAIHMYGTRQSKLFYVKNTNTPSDYCHSLSNV